MRRMVVVIVCLPLLLAGCDDEPTAAPEHVRASTPRETTSPEESRGFEVAPPVTLDLDGDQVDLQPWTSCYGNGCADGMPPPDPYDVGDRDEVRFTYPLADWRFSATFRQVTESNRCYRGFEAPVERTGDGTWVIRPVAYPGTYDVDINGRGDGDLYTTFRWTTTVQGELPKPSARLSPVHSRQGSIEHWGVSVNVSDLADLAKPIAGTVEVTAANGRSMTFERPMSYSACTTAGQAFFDTKNKEGRAVAKLGRAPYTYEVTMDLDGVRHTATAVWPNRTDETRYLDLEFDPPLPALE